jgi:predicted oxidoreductase
MLTQTIAQTDITTTRLAYGCGRLINPWRPREMIAEAEFERAVTACIAAYEAGIRCFDNADVYCVGVCEQALGEAFRRVRGMRGDVTIITKCAGMYPYNPDPALTHWWNLTTSHILEAVEGALVRLGIECIDLLLLHHPDYLWNPHDVAEAFLRLRAQGKVRHFGVSNFTPTQVTALARWTDVPLVANEVEISLARLDVFKDGTLDQCYERQMTPIAYSPLAIGRLVAESTVAPDDPRRPLYERLWRELDRAAAAHGISRTAVALAWLLRHPVGILPIIGAPEPEYIRDAVASQEVDLTREEWYRLFFAAEGGALQ